MKEITAVVLINLAVLALTGLVFFLTKSWWSLIILFFMFKTENK